MPVLRRPDFTLRNRSRGLRRWGKLGCSGRGIAATRHHLCPLDRVMPMPVLGRPDFAFGRWPGWRRRESRCTRAPQEGCRWEWRCERRRGSRLLCGFWPKRCLAHRNCQHDASYTQNKIEGRGALSRPPKMLSLAAHFELAPAAAGARVVTTDNTAGFHPGTMGAARSFRKASCSPRARRPPNSFKVQASLRLGKPPAGRE